MAETPSRRREDPGLFVLALPLLLLSCTASLVAPGPQGEGDAWYVSRGSPACEGVYEEGPSPPLRLIWRSGAKGAIVSAPVVAGRSLFVSSLGNDVLQLDSRNGSKLGSHRVDGTPTSSPAVFGDCLFIATQGERHTLRALDLRAGKVRWKREIGDLAGAPLVAQGCLYVGTLDGQIFSFDPSGGDTLWIFTAEDQIYASPAVCDTVLYVGSADHFLYALSARTGRLLWKADLGAAVYTTPALSGGRAYLGAVDGTLHCVDGQDGTTLWTFEAGGPIHSSAAVAEERLYFGCDDGAVYALSTSTGKPLWKFETDGVITASPVVTRGVLYIGSADRVFYALDAFTGKELWRYETKGAIEASASLSRYGVYVGSTDRFLYAFGPR